MRSLTKLVLFFAFSTGIFARADGIIVYGRDWSFSVKEAVSGCMVE